MVFKRVLSSGRIIRARKTSLGRTSLRCGCVLKNPQAIARGAWRNRYGFKVTYQYAAAVYCWGRTALTWPSHHNTLPVLR